MKLAKNQLLILVVIIFSIVVAIGIWFVINYNADNGVKIMNSEVVSATDDLSSNQIGVHIKGEVISPGFYSLKKGSYAKDLIDAAGGATENADLNTVNLARILKDGEEFIVFPKGYTEDTAVPDSKENATDKGSAYKTAKPQPADKTSAKGSAKTAAEPKYTEKPKLLQGETININTATKEDFARLPGIGETIAIRIVEYRTKVSKFETIEDIKKVSGIGDAKFEALKGYIVV